MEVDRIKQSGGLDCVTVEDFVLARLCQKIRNPDLTTGREEWENWNLGQNAIGAAEELNYFCHNRGGRDRNRNKTYAHTCVPGPCSGRTVKRTCSSSRRIQTTRPSWSSEAVSSGLD